MSEEEALQKVAAGRFSLLTAEDHISIIIASYYTDNMGNNPFYISHPFTILSYTADVALRLAPFIHDLRFFFIH